MHRRRQAPPPSVEVFAPEHRHSRGIHSPFELVVDFLDAAQPGHPRGDLLRLRGAHRPLEPDAVSVGVNPNAAGVRAEASELRTHALLEPDIGRRRAVQSPHLGLEALGAMHEVARADPRRLPNLVRGVLRLVAHDGSALPAPPGIQKPCESGAEDEP